jgi:oxygen-independent coproporphyrinogen III oxidase
LEHYEVSNYARPGMRSRHNSSYWTGAPYVGLGPSAHGFDGIIRRWNVRNYAEWRDKACERQDPIGGSETLTDENRIAESVYLGLRTSEGLELQSADMELAARWRHEGWIEIDEHRVARCTATGWLRLDALASALTHHRSR